MHVWSRDHGWLRLEPRTLPIDATPQLAFAPLDDAALVRAAKEAGLCISKCWDVDLFLDPAGRADDDEWVAAADTPHERRQRQESVDTMRNRAQEALAKLRRFSELVREQPRA